jgi:hypothetical protein
LRNLRFVQISASLISLARGLAPLPNGGDGHKCEHSGRGPSGPDCPLMLPVVLADQSAEVGDAADRRRQLGDRPHEFRIAARQTGAQLFPLNDCPKIHPLRFFAKNA